MDDAATVAVREQTFFIACMHELNVQQHSPGTILAIDVLLHLTTDAAADLHELCATNTSDKTRVANNIKRLYVLGNKLSTTFMRMTGSERGWIDGLEDPKYNIIFENIHKIQVLVTELQYRFEKNAGKVGMIVLLSHATWTQDLVNKLLASVEAQEPSEEEVRKGTPGHRIHAKPAIEIVRSYCRLDGIFNRFRGSNVCDKFVKQTPADFDVRMAQFYAAVNWLIESVLLPADEVEDYGDATLCAIKLKLVEEVRVVMCMMDETLIKAVKLEGMPTVTDNRARESHI